MRGLRWGSGTLNIVDWCAENGNSPPKWKEEAGSVFVVFAPATPGGGVEATREATREVAGEVIGRDTRQVPDKYPTSARQVTQQEVSVLQDAVDPSTRAALQESAEKGRALVLSPFEERVKRPTAETSQRRNQFVGALAAAVFVAYADPGGKTEEFCRSVLRSGKPLYAFESHYNRSMVDAGARPIETKKFAQWAGSLKA